MVASPFDSVEPRPVSILDVELYVLNGGEAHAFVPHAQHEVSVERAAVELRAHVGSQELAIGTRHRVREIPFDAEPAGVLDVAGEELDREIAAGVISDEER